MPESVSTEEKKTSSQTCYVCGSDRIRYSFVRNGNAVYRCEDCNFVFLNPQPADEALEQIYKEGYFLEDDSAENVRSVSEMKTFTAKAYLEQLIGYSGQTTGRLLEVGCGNGDFIALAKQKGFKVTGVEISQHAAGIANSKLEEECVVCGILENVDLPSGHFDVCVLFDAIEHVRDPLTFLRKVYSLLVPGGVLFIVTPSLDSWSARLLQKNWMEFKTEHLHYFDSQTIQNALAKTGFDNVYISPNYKYLTLEYIRRHFRKFKVPLFTELILGLSFLMPYKLRNTRVKVVASGMNVLSRKAQVRAIPVVSIVVPVYNERETFPQLIKALLEKELPGLEKETIIVESNSTDGTRDEVLRYKDTPGVRLVFEDKPQGKGHAVRTGLKYATGEFIIIQDGDLEYDLNDYDELLKPLVKHQRAFVLGSRHSKGWKMRHFVDQPEVSLIMNFGQIFFTTLLNVFCGSRLKDPFTMYKVFRRDCLYGLTFAANRFDFDFELVMKLLRKGYTPLEIPVNYNSRSFKEGKKVSLIKDPVLWIWALIRFRFGPLYGKKIQYLKTGKR